MAGKTESQAKQTKADDFYVAIARLSAKRSKDAICQNGACIVDQDDDRIISIGYNGMPLNCRDELMPWIGKNDACSHLKQLYVVHAEMNAIVSMTPQSVAKCTMYTTSCPCLECRKMICKSGVAKVFYLKEQSENLTNRQNDEPPGSKYVFLKKEDLPDENEIVFADDISTSESGPISWEQYFMGIAILAKDLKSKEVSPKIATLTPDSLKWTFETLTPTCESIQFKNAAPIIFEIATFTLTPTSLNSKSRV